MEFKKDIGLMKVTSGHHQQYLLLKT
jgi:hypothetical protein